MSIPSSVVDIRQRFIEYYRQRDFRLLPPAPMLHPSIPMSFVMSAGLAQVATSLTNPKNRFRHQVSMRR